MEKIHVYLGNEDSCDFVLESKKYIWHSTKNWMNTNCKNQKITQTFTEDQCDTLNIIFTSLWPIYNCDYMNEKEVLKIVKIAHICEMNHFLKHVIININERQLEYMLENHTIPELFKTLDDCRKSKMLRKILEDLLEKFYLITFTDNDDNNKKYYLFDRIQEFDLSKETLLFIMNLMKNKLKIYF